MSYKEKAWSRMTLNSGDRTKTSATHLKRRVSQFVRLRAHFTPDIIELNRTAQNKSQSKCKKMLGFFCFIFFTVLCLSKAFTLLDCVCYSVLFSG